MSRRPVHALLAAALCAGFAVLVWALAFEAALGRAADEAALGGFVELQSTRAASLAEAIAAVCNPSNYVFPAAAVTVCALLVRGPRGALAVGAILLTANAITQYLKPALAEPRLVPGLVDAHVAAASWPSGHSTAAMALALCAVLAAPTALRRIVAVAGALFAAGVAYSVVLLGWHLPSDALGGFAVAGATTSVAMAGLWAADAHWPAGAGRRVLRRAHVSIARPVALVAVAAIGLVLLRVATWLPGPEQQLAFLAFGGAIVALGLALSAATARALPA